MVKRYLFLFWFLLFAFTPLEAVKAEAVSEVEEMYVTTEDIILDIVFPTIDKRVIKEYGGGPLFGWQWNRIVGINYNNDHSYDVSVRIQIDSKHDEFVEDLVKVRISPSCDSGKINKMKCNHDFKIEILDYKHLSQ